MVHMTSFHALGFGRTPDFISLSLHGQNTVVAQMRATHVGLVFAAVGVPLGFVVLAVHDQVAVRLHAQAVDVRVGRVRGPERLPAVDDKVTVLLYRDITSS